MKPIRWYVRESDLLNKENKCVGKGIFIDQGEAIRGYEAFAEFDTYSDARLYALDLYYTYSREGKDAYVIVGGREIRTPREAGGKK